METKINAFGDVIGYDKLFNVNNKWFIIIRYTDKDDIYKEDKKDALLVSDDYEHWTKADISADGMCIYYDLSYSNGIYYCHTDQDDKSYSTIYYSHDGIHWMEADLQKAVYIHGLYPGDEAICCIYDKEDKNDCLACSIDGKTWFKIPIFNGTKIRDVHYHNHQWYFIVGAEDDLQTKICKTEELLTYFIP